MPHTPSPELENLGTFIVASVELIPGGFEAMSTDGRTALGCIEGDDWEAHTISTPAEMMIGGDLDQLRRIGRDAKAMAG